MEVGLAHQRDVEAVAAAREAGERDPKPTHEPKARTALGAAEHELEVAQARLLRVRTEYERLSEKQRPAWRRAVEREWKKADQQQRRRVEELGAIFAAADRKLDVRSRAELIKLFAEQAASAERLPA